MKLTLTNFGKGQLFLCICYYYSISLSVFSFTSDDFTVSIKKETVIVLDNASWCTSTEFINKIEGWKQKELHVFFLPTYSPELNMNKAKGLFKHVIIDFNIHKRY